MKKFLAAAAVLLMLTAQVEAAPFTQAQLDKMFAEIESPANKSTLNLNVETLKERFNGIMTPILQEATGSDDVSGVAHLFLIKEYKVFSKPDSDMFANVFGDYRVAIVGNCAANGDFEVLSLNYTTPENEEESIFTIWLLTAFVKSISPEVNVQELMGELTAENSSGTAIKDGVKYSISEDGNLNFLTAVTNK